MSPFERPTVSPGATSEADAFRELEHQNIERIRKLRAHDRIEARVKVVLQPANSSALLQLKLQGVTQDVSRGGCGAVFPLPIGVGDVYRLRFDDSLQLPLVFARCMRCRLLREDAYEAGFRFFDEVTLPGALEDAEGDGLLD